jgi:hypothetical protein
LAKARLAPASRNLPCPALIAHHFKSLRHSAVPCPLFSNNHPKAKAAHAAALDCCATLTASSVAMGANPGLVSVEAADSWFDKVHGQFLGMPRYRKHKHKNLNFFDAS